MEMQRIVQLLIHVWAQLWSPRQSFSTVESDNALLKLLKTKYNYASSDCAARIISANPGALNPGAVLSSSKETSLRNLCATPNKHITIELCQEIIPEVLVLANYELFSSTVKKFTVFGSRNLDVPLMDWLPLGVFEAKNVHRDQLFPLSSGRLGRNFIRYLRINFDSHYGNEHFCPISSVRAYGKTMLEEFHEENRLEADNLPALSNETEEQELNRLAAELQQVHQEIERLELLQLERHECCFHPLMQHPQCFSDDESLNGLKSRAVILESEMMSLSAQINRQRPGNVYRDLSERLKKLESLLPISVGNLQILIPNQRLEQSRPLNTFLPPTEVPLFDLKQLQSQLHVQQFWINALLTANVLLFLAVLLCLFKLFRRQEKISYASKSGELRRLPLSALKSPSISSTSGHSSHSSLPSPSLSNPGVVLSDDEFTMGDSAVRSDGSILFSRRSVDRMQ